MKRIDVGQTITILANLGVIAGIVFLAAEISQSNRIAIRDARSELTERTYELQSAILHNPETAELMVKLGEKQAKLTPQEEYRARSYATLIVNLAATINLNWEDGFLTEDALARNLQALGGNIRRTPGIAPFLMEMLPQGDVARDNETFGFVWDEVERLQ
jgi:hypothetical protein